MRGQRILLLGLVGFVSFLSGGWLLQRGGSQAGTVYQQARLFDDVLGYVADFYVDSVTEADLYDKAIDGLLNELEDPYAQFLRPRDFEELTESTTGNYGGLGIRIDVRDGWITIIAPIAGTPASEAGLDVGDRIVEVDGESTYGWKDNEAVERLRGPPGSEVRIGIARPGMPEVLQFTLKRAEIHVDAIQLATVVEGNVGYISLVYASISETLADELVPAVDSLRRQGAQSLVLDLRNNPGGLLDQGVAVSDLFLDPGQEIVATRGRARGTSDTYLARTPQQWPDLPIVVLVNGGTASAAEIIAGALQDHDRALVLGTPTFGKGLVQTVFRLGRAQALRLTTARWYTPSGRTIQRDLRAAIAADGSPHPDALRARGDTLGIEASEIFRTDGGRLVVGGGGIRPDIVVRPDTLTDAEMTFVRALGSDLPVYRDVMTSYALELKAAGTVTHRDFQATAAMRAEVLRRLRARDVEITDAEFEGARRFVEQELEYEVLRYVFSREEESRRRIANDAQMQQALALLAGTPPSTPELLAHADGEPAPRRTP